MSFYRPVRVGPGKTNMQHPDFPSIRIGIMEFTQMYVERSLAPYIGKSFYKSTKDSMVKDIQSMLSEIRKEVGR